MPDLDEPADDPRSKLHAGGGGGGGGSGGWNGGATGIGNPLEYQATAGSGGLSLPTYPPSGPKPPQHGTSGAQAPSGPSAAASSASPGLANAGSTASAGTQNAAQPGPALPFEGSPNQGGIASSAPSAMISSAASDSSTLRFEPNIGQAVAGADYVAQAQGLQVSLNAGGMTFDLGTPQTASAPADPADLINLEFIGGNANAQSQGLDPASTVSQDNGPTGSLATSPTSPNSPTSPTPTPGLPTPSIDYGQVTYQSVWQGIDATYLSNAQNQFSFDLTVNPGADPSQIDIGVTGASSLAIGAGGSLSIEDGNGSTLTEAAPYIYQTVNGVQQQIAGQYVLLGNDRIGFQLGQYNHALALVIDPTYYNFGSNGGGDVWEGEMVFVNVMTPPLYGDFTDDGTDPPTFSTYQSGVSGTTVDWTYDASGNSFAVFTAPSDIILAERPSGTYEAFPAGTTITLTWPTDSTEPGPSDSVSWTTDTTSGATVALSASPSPSTYGQSVTFTATVSSTTGGSTPTGSVILVDGTTMLGSGTLDGSGTATISTSALSAGSSQTITAVYSGDINYASTAGTTSQTVDPATLTITADDQSMVYGASVPTLTASYSGFVNGDTSASLSTAPTLSTTATSSSSVDGGPYTISVSGAVDPNYTISCVDGSLTVTPAPLTITADDQSMAYGASVPTLTASYSGFVNDDTSASLTTLPTLSTSALSTSPTGVYPIAASGAADSNYDISYVDGMLSVNGFPWASVPEGNDEVGLRSPAAPSQSAKLLGYDGYAVYDYPLDLDQSPGTNVGGNPDLVYDSGTVDPAPVMQLSVRLAEPATDIVATLIWDGSSVGATTFTTTGSTAGETLQLAMQAPAGQTTGAHTWTIDLAIAYTGVDGVKTPHVSGEAFVVNESASPFGAGWNISYMEQLIPISAIGANPAGLLRVFGDGESEFYTANGSGFISPVGDTGTLEAVGGGYEYIDLSNDIYTFNSSGLLTGWLSGDSESAFTFTYDASDLAAIETPDGAVTSVVYSSGSVSALVVNEDSFAVTRAYTMTNSSSDLTVVENSAGGLSTFTYDAEGHLTDGENGSLQQGWVYSDGMVTQQTIGGSTADVTPSLAQGLTTADVGDNRSVTTDPLGNVTRSLYNQAGQMIEQFSPNGGVSVWNYNSSGFLISYTNPLNQTTTYTVNAAGYDTSVETPDGAITTYTYDVENYLLTVTNPLGQTTTYTYYSNGLLETTENALTQVTTDTYDANGNLQTVTNALNETTTYIYDSDNQLTGTIDPLGNITTTAYDANGDPVAVTDPNGNVTTIVYDAGLPDLGQYAAGFEFNPSSPPQARIGAFDDGSIPTFNPDPMAQIVEPLGDTTTFIYDPSSGQLIGTIDPLGDRTSYVYDSAGNETEEIEAVGTSLQRTITMTYDADDHLISSTNALNETTTYTYDGDGNLIAVTNPLGEITTTVYNAADEAIAVIDPRGYATTTVYDADGEPTVTIDPLGNRTTTVYDADGNVIAVTDPNGNTTSFVYDAANELIATIDPLGNRTTTVYDAAGDAVESIDPNGNITTTVYDADGDPTVSVDPLGNRTTSVYDADGNVIKTIDPNGGVTTYVYNADNELTVAIDPLSHRTTTVYDADGNAVETIDPNGGITKSVFDALGRDTVTIDPLGNRTTYTYDAADELVATTDPNGNTTSYVYDLAGEQTVVVDPLGNRTTTVYDCDGNVVNTIDADGNKTTYVYNADDESVETIDPLGNITATAYDGDGNVIATVDAEGNRTTYGYDADDRLVSVEQPSGGITTTVYDADGNVVNTIDALGDTTTSVYNADNELTESIDADGDITTYQYDGDGNQTVLIDPDGNRTTSVYDADDRLVETMTPIGNTTYSYDADGNLTGTTDALGQVRDFSYNADSEETGQQWFNSSGDLVNTQTFTYDADGNQLTAADENGAYTYTYDADDQVASVQEPFGLTLTFTYDGVGNRLTVEDSEGGLQTSTYDGDNNLTEVQSTGNGATLSYDYTYTADSQVATIKEYSDLTGTTLVGETEDAYDTTGRMTGQEFIDGSDAVYRAITYSYDQASHLTSEDDNGTLTTFTYDAAGQLLGNGATTYTYDANGNRDSSGYSVGADNEITNDGTWTYTYDADGDLIEQSEGADAITWYYTYDVANQLVQAAEYSAPGGLLEQQINYTYDVYGNLLSRTQYNGSLDVVAVANYGYDGWSTQLDFQGNSPNYIGQENWNIWVTLNASNDLTTRTLFGNSINDPVARITPIEGESTAVAWYVADYQGSIIGMLDGSGSVAATMTYDGFGNQTSNSNPSFTDQYGFQGMRFESADNSYDDNARWLNMYLDRFDSQDPMGFAAGDTDLYRFVGNGFTDGSDPSGLSWLSRQWTDSYVEAVTNGLGEGFTNVTTGGGNAVVELGQLARDTGNAVISGNSLVTNYLFGTGVYQFDLHSNTMIGYNQATQTSVRAQTEYLIKAMIDGGSLGIVPIARANAYYIETGDAAGASQMLGGVAATNLIAAAGVKVTTPIADAALARLFPNPPAPKNVIPRANVVGVAESSDTITLWKAPSKGNTGAAGEVTNGFDAAKYPGNGPYFATDKPIAEGFKVHGPYENGLQEINIPRSTFDELVSKGVIQVDGQYAAGRSWHVPADKLAEFNAAVKNGTTNKYHPQ